MITDCVNEVTEEAGQHEEMDLRNIHILQNHNKSQQKVHSSFPR